jgi:hypothetical protein
VNKKKQKNFMNLGRGILPRCYHAPPLSKKDFFAEASVEAPALTHPRPRFKKVFGFFFTKKNRLLILL